MKPVLSALVNKLSHIELRGWLLLSGLILAIFSLRSDWLFRADFRLFQLSSYFVSSPVGSSDIGIIILPSDEVKSWHEDIHSAGRLGALLSNILHASSSTVGLLLEQPLNLGKSGADLVLEELIKNEKKKSESVIKAKELVQRREFLLAFLKDKRVVIGVADTMPAGQKPIEVESGQLTKWPKLVREWWWPSTYENTFQKKGTLPSPLIDHYIQIKLSRQQERQLVVGDARAALYPSFFTRYLLAVEKMNHPNGKQELLWREDQGLIFGTKQIPASPEGKFLSFNRATNRMAPRIITIPLDDAFARGAFPKYLFIASEDNTRVNKLAADLYSVLNNNTLHKPWWFDVLERGLILFTTLYLCFVVPRIRGSVGATVSSIFIFTAVLVQIIFAVTHQYFLPLMLSNLWLIAGHFAVVAWAKRRDRWNSAIERADSAVLVQADTLMERGELLSARDALANCQTRNDVLQKLYEIASGFSEKRQYLAAVKTLKMIAARKKNFRDTEQKIQTLNTMAATQGKPLDKTAKFGATAHLEMPEVFPSVLGRYRVEEELGRGAMGVVYKGFDPKISRKVAIKTFNYKQFQVEQREDLKRRFYREAEAAGRLNHPNIVSVFDIGEESDLAFIAMDFAGGKPLSTFTHSDGLLPIFEVYRIICDVAQALDYAHQNHIVHRDIKPGNIMYAPSPYQIKVTDFGIARLMDDSKTSTGEILGSPLYMSPEQLKGKKVTGASDIFSLGVTFYQLLTGSLPFLGDNLASLTYEVIHGKHKGVRAVRKELPVSASRIINQCLQKSPEDRYGSAAELALVLKKSIKRDFSQAAKKIGFM